MNKVALLLMLVVTFSCSMQTISADCDPVAGQGVKIDDSCASGGLGCNAGGQGQTCRFCGFNDYPDC
jgi:hypothetical protein